MQWPTHWNQGAWGTAIGTASFVMSLGAFSVAFFIGRRIRRQLTGSRLHGAIGRLEGAARELGHAATGSPAEMSMAMWLWRRSATEVRVLAEAARPQTSDIDD